MAIHERTPVAYDYKKPQDADSRLLCQYWQQNPRGMLGIMQQCLSGHAPCSRRGWVFTRVRIALPPGEVATRHVQAHTVTRQERDRGRPEIDADFIDAPRFYQPCGPFDTSTVT